MRKIYITDYLFGFVVLSVVWTLASGLYIEGFWLAGPVCLLPVFILFSLVFFINLIMHLIKYKKINKIQLIYLCVSGVLFGVDYYYIFVSHILEINLFIG